MHLNHNLKKEIIYIVYLKMDNKMKKKITSQ